MSNPSDNIRTIRHDLSPYLFNFLRDDDAPTILHEILTSGTLLSKEHEYIYALQMRRLLATFLI